MSDTPWLAFSRRHSKQDIGEAFTEAIELYRQRRLRGPQSAIIHENDAQHLDVPPTVAVTLTTAHPGTFLLGDDEP